MYLVVPPLFYVNFDCGFLFFFFFEVYVAAIRDLKM